MPLLLVVPLALIALVVLMAEVPSSSPVNSVDTVSGAKSICNSTGLRYLFHPSTNREAQQ
jgi:hypothetical protein